MKENGSSFLERPDCVRILKNAEKTNSLVYLFGETGFGKTDLAERYFRDRPHQVISCRACTAEQLQNCIALPDPLILDDLFLLPEDPAVQATVIRLAAERKGFLIIISRSQFPPWLMPAFYAKDHVILNEEALKPSAESIRRFFLGCDLMIEPETAVHILERTQGCCLFILQLRAEMLEKGCGYSESVFEAAEKVFGDYVSAVSVQHFPAEMLQALMILSIPDSFTDESAYGITGMEYVSRLLKKAKMLGNFLFCTGGIYVLRMPMRRILYQMALERLGNSAVRMYTDRAAAWYEVHGQLDRAALLYRRNGDSKKLRELLEKNAMLNPAIGYYYELRNYYMELPQEEAETSPNLMCALSMLHAILLDVERSEMWYERLREFAETAKGELRREAKARLVYLSIALPHRNSVGLIDVFKGIPQLLGKKFRLPEFSVTSNTPSLMNGGKDFCSWSKHDEEIAATLGKIVSVVLSRNGYGVVSTALGESYFEKARDNQLVYATLNQGLMEAEAGGNYELVLVTTTLALRLKLLEGKIDAAEALLGSMQQKFSDVNVNSVTYMKLQPCLDSIACRLALFRGNHDLPENWMRTAPDENAGFNIMDRFFYGTKLRIYISRGMYQEALNLIRKLEFFAEICCRVYIRIETMIFKAIILYRTGEDWHATFRDALKLASEYHFVRIFSEKGDAVIPLLREYINRNELPKGQQAWFQKILDETQMVALYYPLWLKPTAPDVMLKPKPLAILKLQANGYSITEIARNLGMKPETVRYYVKQTYQKLGVSSKTSAILTARTLNLI